MGLLGATMGAGQGMAEFGKMGVANAFETERDKNRFAAETERDKIRLEANERIQERHDAAAEERAKRIEEWKLEADLKKLDDPRYIGAKKRQAELDAATAASKAEAEESAKLRAKNSPDAIKAEERAHQRKLNEINAEADAKARAEKNKSPGGWKPDEADKEVRALVAKGMGIDSANFTNFSAQTEKRFINNISAASSLMAKDPSLTPAAAVQKVLASDYSAMGSDADAKEKESAARKQATKEANGKAGFLSSDEDDFGPEGRQAWINKRTQELMDSQPTPSATPSKNSSTIPANGPRIGDVVDGYRFKGGNPNDPKAWEVAK